MTWRTWARMPSRTAWDLSMRCCSWAASWLSSGRVTIGNFLPLDYAVLKAWARLTFVAFQKFVNGKGFGEREGATKRVGENQKETADPTARRGRLFALSKNISRRGPRNCRSLHGTPGQVGSPRFPVETCGFGQLHVVLFRENHISGTGKSGEVGNPGTLLMNKMCSR